MATLTISPWVPEVIILKSSPSGPQAAAGLGPLTEVSGNLLLESLLLTSPVI